MKGTLFFDIGNVLLFFSHEKMCKQTADLTKLPLQRVHDFLFKEGYGVDYELGNVSTEKIHEHFSNLTPHAIDFFELLKATSDIFEPNEEIIPIVEELESKGHNLILLSNTCEVHFNYAYSHFPVLRNFHDHILSYEVNLRKPDKAIYQKALAMAHSTPSFYIDDIPEYVQTAKRTGLDATSYKTADRLRKELQKRNFL